MVTLEQVEKLKERANVSYEDAKIALEASQGDLLEAVIYLEKMGKVPAPQSGSFNTAWAANGEGGKRRGGLGADRNGYQYEHECKKRRSSFGQQMKALWAGFCRLVHKANSNQFEIHRHGRCLVDIPVTLLLIAILFFFWVTIPLLIIALFFDCRYRFSGPDLEKKGINSVMDSAAETAESIKRSVGEEHIVDASCEEVDDSK